MHEWVVNPGTPFLLTLAADARLCQTDYTDDQIWELAINRGEPPAISLDTTYGLRARKQRFLPLFGERDSRKIDPLEFETPITVRTYHPNYVKMDFYPFSELSVILEYWIPDSHSAAGRVTVTNEAKITRHIDLTWIALLSPDPSGSRMAIDEIENVTVLTGKTGNLEPAVFLRGGAYASSGPFPGLEIQLALNSHESASSICVIASLADAYESLKLARDTASLPWDSEVAKLELTNSNDLQIITGKPEWNLVFELSQKIASSLLLSPTQYLPGRSFVQTRQPDQGYSIRGDGSDFNHLWNGQTVLQSWFLSNELLPTQTQFGQDLIRNFIYAQNEEGMVDWKPGLGNQRTSMAATPLLAHFAWSVFQQTQDLAFLEEIYPALLKFFDYWFSIGMDLDQDGLPEWKHPRQTGLEDHPVFSFWIPGSYGIDISTFECPGLNSWLFMEGQALLSIAESINDLSSVHKITLHINQLRHAILESWDAEVNCFQYQDRDTHFSVDSQVLFKGKNFGEQLIHQAFSKPVRINVHLVRQSESTRRIVFFIHGNSPSGEHRIERISPEQFRWHLADGFATSERVYSEIEKISIEGNEPDDWITVSTVGHRAMDITLFLPVFAQIPSFEMSQKMVRNVLMRQDLFWQPGGLPNFPVTQFNPMGEISIIMNSMVLQGLLKYGLHTEAAELLTRLMDTLAYCVNKTGDFRRLYNPETKDGKGERNSLEGLAPLGTFLKIIGLEFINPWRIFVRGSNPFSWPVTVKYKGTTVLKHKAKTTVVFPDGQSITINDESPHILALE
jgi:hypothetical protein